MTGALAYLLCIAPRKDGSRIVHCGTSAAVTDGASPRCPDCAGRMAPVSVPVP